MCSINDPFSNSPLSHCAALILITPSPMCSVNNLFSHSPLSHCAALILITPSPMCSVNNPFSHSPLSHCAALILIIPSPMCSVNDLFFLSQSPSHQEVLMIPFFLSCCLSALLSRVSGALSPSVSVKGQQ